MKKNKTLMIAGSIMIAVISILLIYVVLISTGVVTAREYTLRIEAIDAAKEYDGTPLTLSEYRVVEGQDILTKKNHTLSVSFEGNQTDAGTSVGHLIVAVFDSSNADVTKKYNIITNDAELTVTPRSIKLRSKSIEKQYDGTPLSVDDISGTVYEHLTGEAVTGQTIKYIVSGEIAEIGSTYVDISMEITDSNGNVVNPANYQIIYEDEESHGKLTITPRYIYVKTDSLTVSYDGKDHSSSGVSWDVSRSNLAPGDKISYVTPTTSAVNAGEYLINEFNIKVVNSSGNDVSEYYGADPKSNFGKLTILPIKITVDTASFPLTKVYDGTPLDPAKENSYYVKNWSQAPAGDKYEITFANTLTEVGEVDNEATIIIRNSNNEDVTENYEITYEFGKITVKARQITIKTYSEVHEFNGQAIYGKDVVDSVTGHNYDIIVGSIAEGQTLKLELNAKISSGGEVTNAITNLYIVDAANNDVSDNYDITKDEGTLEITKVFLSIITDSGEWTYDGTAHSVEKANIQGLPNDCTITYRNWPTVTDATYNRELDEVTTVTNKPDYTIFDKNNNVIYDQASGITDNFVILEETWGTLCVKPLEVSITTQSKTDFVYNGQTCSNHLYEIQGLRSGDKAGAMTWPDITDVQRDSFGNVIAIDNIPTFEIFDSKGKNITDNYRIKGTYGKLKVNPITCVVSTSSINKTYDGKPIKVTENDYSIDCQLATGDKISEVYTINDYINVLKNGANIGSRPNEISFIITNKSGQDVTNNYEIIYAQKGDLQVTPIYLTVTTPGAEITYDGDFHKYDTGYTVTAPNGVPENIHYEVSGFGSYKDANQNGYDNTCVVNFFDADDPNLNMNNNIFVTTNYGKIIINKIKVNVSTNSLEKTYDGTPLTSDEIVIPDSDLEMLTTKGITYEITKSTSITNVYRSGKVVSGVNNFVELAFYKNSEIITKNIEVVYNCGKLQINPIPITIQTQITRTKEGKVYSKTYDGTEIKDDQIYVENTYLTLLDSFDAEIVVDKSTTISNVQWSKNTVTNVENSITVRILSGVDDLTNNFDITYDTGYLRIDPIKVTGQAEETRLLDGKILSHVYDGNSISAGTLYFSTSDKNTLAAAGITYTAGDSPTVTNVTWKNKKEADYVKNSIIVTFYKDGKDITKNVEMTNDFGYLFIKPVTITIYTAQTRLIGSKTLSKRFDGEPIYDNELFLYDADKASLDALNAELQLVSYEIFTEVGKKDNKIEVKVVDKTTNADYTDNFNIIYETGKLEVTGIKITVTSGSSEFTYDGQGHSVDTLTITKGIESLDGYTYEFMNVQAPEFTDVLYNSNDVVTSYENDVKFDLVIKKNGVVVTDNIDVSYTKGTVKIKPYTINISLDGAEKVFDGTPITQANWIYLIQAQKNMLENLGYTLDINVTGSQTLVGQSENYFTYTITDVYDADQTKNFIVTNKASNTKLKINPLKITVISDSKSKIYDGTALTYEEILSAINLPSGFDYDTTFTGTQTEVGYSDNTFYITITDDEGKDVNGTSRFNGCFDITYTYGKLEVLPYITGTGNLTSQTATASSEITTFTVKSNLTGILYLRDRSYGDYTGVGWEYADPFEDLNYGYNGSMIASKALEEASYSTIGTATINISSGLPYLVPYYSTNLFEGNMDDTHIANVHGDGAYSLDYYSYNYDSADLYITNNEYNEFEQAYYEYVLNNYTSISSALQTTLLKLAKDAGINPGDANLIYEIANYVQTNYSYGNNPRRKGTEDLVSLFIKDRKGTCQDFASLATMMYRAFDIPARFVTGFVCDIQTANTYQDVKQTDAHAWVEVYIQGMGWIAVEVTKGLPANISDSGIGGGGGGGASGGAGQTGELPSSGSTPTESPIFQIRTNQSGEIYLRCTSYGNYNGKGFDEVEEGDRYSGASVNPLNLPAASLNDVVKNPSTIYINMTANNFSMYVEPYYTISDLSAYDDVYIDEDYSSIYSVDYYATTNISNRKALSGTNATVEDDYYSYYVQDNYLLLDGCSPELLEYFATIVAQKGFNKNNANIINDVATYIKTAATYKYEFSSIPSDCKDYVYYFLHDSKEGVCSLYSAAATMLYRYLGIPARYVTGVKTTVLAEEINQWVDVPDSSSHAWVEVYIDGFGWMPVEVTGSRSNNTGSNKSPNTKSITIYPISKTVKYSDLNGPIEITDIYLSHTYTVQGYSIEGEVSILGDPTSPGFYTTTIDSFTIYKDGEDVTGMFNVTCKDGTLQIYYETIDITTKSAVKEYDGTALKCEEYYSIDTSKLRPGDYIDESAITFINPGQTKIGTSINSISKENLIKDEYDNDVTNLYYIHLTSGSLKVTKRSLTLTAGSIELSYDEFLDLGVNEFTYDEYTITDGTLLPNHHIESIEMDPDSYISEEEDIWDCINSIIDIVIYDENDNDVTSYYDLTFVDGSIFMY